MPEKQKAQVLQAFFECRMTYRQPVFDLRTLHSELAPALYQALRKWNVGLENVTWKQSPLNASEIQVVLSLMSGRVAFSVGLGQATLFVSNPNWSEAPLILEIGEAGFCALVDGKKINVDKWQASVWMHLATADQSGKAVVSKFIRDAGKDTSDDPVIAYGFSVYRRDSSWVVDKSVLYPDALFVRINSTFGSDTTLPEIADWLRKEEESVLDSLGLEVA
jgi:hypothetical protein